MRHDTQVSFDQQVEAVRGGTILAHDNKAYGRWRTSVMRRDGTAGTRKGLAQLKLAARGNVEAGGFEFRN